MRIAIGSDHRGFELKKVVIKLVTEAGHSHHDFGCYSPESIDYPDIARQVAEAVAKGDCELGILMCYTGIGMSIAANKIRGIRAALCHSEFTAHRARQHNDANILCLAAGQARYDIVRETVNAFLTTEFEGGRHKQRLGKIEAMECG